MCQLNRNDRRYLQRKAEILSHLLTRNHHFRLHYSDPKTCACTHTYSNLFILQRS